MKDAAFALKDGVTRHVDCRGRAWTERQDAGRWAIVNPHGLRSGTQADIIDLQDLEHRGRDFARRRNDRLLLADCIGHGGHHVVRAIGLEHGPCRELALAERRSLDGERCERC